MTAISFPSRISDSAKCFLEKHPETWEAIESAKNSSPGTCLLFWKFIVRGFPNTNFEISLEDQVKTFSRTYRSRVSREEIKEIAQEIFSQLESDGILERLDGDQYRGGVSACHLQVLFM